MYLDFILINFRINFNKPYPLNDSITWRWINSALFGAFVFVFLAVFQPFELNQLSENTILIALGYGFVCFIIMAILNVGIYLLFPSFFQEKTWVTSKEIFWVLLNVLVIGIGNYLYSVGIKIIPSNWSNFLLFESYTLAVGVFPIVISVLVNQKRLSHKFEKESDELNKQIEQKSANTANDKKKVNITSDSESDNIELELSDFLYAKSDDNYVTIHYLDHDKREAKLMRTTLRKIESLFSHTYDVIRCHRSYVINLNQVEHFSGNAQGYKLHVKGVEELIPVSRKLNKSIKNYLSGSS